MDGQSIRTALLADLILTTSTDDFHSNSNQEQMRPALFLTLHYRLLKWSAKVIDCDKQIIINDSAPLLL